MGAFLTIFAPNLSIYHQNYVKNGFIYKTVNQIIFFSTQCIILLLFLLFSQIKIGGALWAPPPIKTKVWKRPIKSKVKHLNWTRISFELTIRFLTCLHWYFWFDINLNLTFDGPFSDLSFDGGGLKVPPLFLFVKTLEKVIRLCTVLKKKLFDWQF